MAPSVDETSTGNSDVRITDLDAMQLAGIAGQSLVKVETDAGVVGYGESGADGPTVRAQLDLLEKDLIGKDPLNRERHYTVLLGRQHPYRPHVPTVSGVDIALWDLAGKLLDRPASELLTGRFRDSVPMYVNDGPADPLDPDSCRVWGERIRDETPYTAVKVTFDDAVASGSRDMRAPGRRRRTLTQSELAALERAAANVREGLGQDVDFIVHCHNEWDLPSAKGIADAVASANPLWVEDPLSIPYADSWEQLTDGSPVRILTGEKLERTHEFERFLNNGAVDALQPDLAFAGGITGCRNVAQAADANHIPVTAHNVGSLVQNAATVHFGASVRNFWTTETRVTQLDLLDEMGDAPGLTVEDGCLQVPDGPGLGVELDEDVLRENRTEGEPYWD